MASTERRTPAFTDPAPIPPRHALEHDNLSPPLGWSGMPAGAAELSIQREDPDGAGGTFVHCLLSGFNPSRTGLAEGEVPPGATEGWNDYGRIGYGGARPPVGDPAHRYFFWICASSEPIGLQQGGTAEELRPALEGRELARGVVIGTYQR